MTQHIDIDGWRQEIVIRVKPDTERAEPLELSTPADRALPWLCWRKGKPERCVIKWSQTWVMARAAAAATLACEPGEVIAKLPTED